ncbi:MAG: two-component regulator propeller domain-containing protein [Ferruginibacter sp.]
MRKIFYTYKLLPFLITTICYSTNLFAQQTASYSYQYYNTSHGLPSPEIICLAKDSKGFLWAGTASGLSMYDGYSFQNYAYAKNGELIGHVNTIKQAADNRLLIGTGTGLFCYENNEIIKISATTTLPQGVNDILEDNENLWLATENGPVKLNIKEVDLTGKKKIVLADHLLRQWWLKNEIMDKRRTVFISKAPDGAIFIAQYSNIFRFFDNKLELIHSIADTHDRINAIFPINKSKIYFDGASSEICLFDNGIVSKSGYTNFYKRLSQTTMPGAWYVGTRGAFYFHPQNGTASTLITFSDIYAVYPTAVLEDNNFMWIASHDGLIKLKPSIFNTYSFDKPQYSNDYYSLTELKNGKILMGANRGKIFEKKENEFSLLHEKLVQDAEIKALYEDERGWLWSASGYKGLVLLRNGKRENFTIENGLHDNSLYHFIKTSNGKLFVTGDQGMSEIIVNVDQSISFKPFIYEPNTSQYAKFFSAIEAPDGTIWLGGEEGLVYLHNDSLQKFTFKGKQLYINFIIKDQQENVWIATSGEGILQCVFNKQNELEIIKQYTENDGLNSLHYLTVLADKENNIWAGSSKGISVIGKSGKFKDRVLNFDESDGFIKPGYSYMRLQQVSDGSIWAVTTFGFTSFQPAQLSPSTIAPLVYLTNIRLIKNSQSITTSFTESAETNKFIHSDNSLNFNFTALDYADQANIRYYYKLEGLDTNWKNSGNLRSISFENLSPGKYTFRVKAINSKSVWSKEDAVYAFIITPPFWKTWWFISLLLITISILSIYFIRRRIRFIKKREAEKTELQKLKAAGYREQLEIEKIINHFATAMNSLNSIDDILWDVTKSCISELNFEDCVIYLKDEERNSLIQKAAWGPKTTDGKKIINPIEIPVGAGIVGNVAEKGKPEIIPDTTTDERYIIDDTRRLSEIAVPIINNGKVLGVIDSEHSQKNFYTERHLEILVTIASLCAGKIDVIKAEQQTKEKEMEVLRLSKDFATSQLTALRMQMNPHFIFNALNSVQHYILQGNVVEANKYLSKFSKLQREILHCSNLQFITLEKEIEILSAYLQLEQFRFGDSFTYEINMTDEIDPDEIKIPPMMLQPFVENAIWHGLMPLYKERNLSIYFDLYTDDILLATIRDNGIGREAAAKLKQNNGQANPVYESKGMSMVQERLKLLQQQYDKPFDAAISDIKDVNGLVQGTMVTLKIFIGNKKL